MSDSFQRTKNFLNRSRNAASDERQRQDTEKQREIENAQKLKVQVLKTKVLKRTVAALLAATAIFVFLIYKTNTALREGSKALVERSEALVERIWTDARQKLEGNDLAAGLLWIAKAYEYEPKPMRKAHEDLYSVRVSAVLAQHPKLHRLWTHNDLTAMAATHDDGKYLVTAGAGTGTHFEVRLWNVENDKDKPLHTLRCSDVVNALKFSSTDNYILAATGKKEAGAGKLQVWSWPEDRQQRPSPEGSLSWPSGAFLDADFLPARPDAKSPSSKPKPGLIAIVQQPKGTTDLWLWSNLDEKNPKPVKVSELKRSNESDSEKPKNSHESIAAPVTALKVSPNGRFVAAWGAGEKSQRDTLYIGNIEQHIADIDSQKLFDIPINSAVKSVAFSANDEWLATVDDQGWATLWDTSKQELLWRWRAHDAAATHVAFGPDDRQLISAGTDRRAKLWEILVTHHQLPEPNDAELGRIKPLGQAESKATILSVELKFTFSHESDVFRANFSPDGRYVATASRDRTVRVWDVATQRPATPPLYHAFAVRSVEFSADGFRLMTQTDYTAQVWNLGAGNPPPTALATSDSLESVSYSSNGRYVITMCRNREVGDQIVVQVRDVDANTDILQEQLKLRDDGKDWYSTSNYNAWISDNGTRALTIVPADGMSQQVQAWSIDIKESFQLNTDGLGSILNAVFSPDGKRLLTASRPSTSSQTSSDPESSAAEWKLQVWNKNKEMGWSRMGECATQVGPVNHVAWDNDGDRLVISSGRDKDEKEGQARLWNLVPDTKKLLKGPILKRDSLNPNQKSSNAVLISVFSHNGKLVATGGADDVAYLWDADTGEPFSPPLPHASDIIHLTFDRDDKQLANCSTADGKCRVWNVKAVRDLKDRNVESAGAEFTLQHSGPVNRAVFGHGGKLLATVSADGMANVWHDGELAAVLVHDGNVQTACFSDDEKRLFTVSYNRQQGGIQRDEPGEVGVPERDRPQVRFSSFSDLCPQRWSWQLAPNASDSGPFANSAELQNHARLLAASQIDDKERSIVPLMPQNSSPKEIERAVELRRLWTDHGDHFYPGFARQLDHLQLADANQALGQWWAVAWHVDRESREKGNDAGKLIDRRNKAWVRHWAARADDHTRIGQWQAAIDDWTQAINKAETPQSSLFESLATAYGRISQWQAAIDNWTLAIDKAETPQSSLFESRARAYGRIGQWQAAIDDWTQAISKAETPQLSQFESRGNARAQLELWTAAVEDFAQIFKSAFSANEGYHLAIVQLKAGQQSDYRKTCSDLMRRVENISEINALNTTVWVCVLAPNGRENNKLGIDIAERCVVGTDEKNYYSKNLYLNTLGAAYYRASEFLKANEILEKRHVKRTPNGDCSKEFPKAIAKRMEQSWIGYSWQ